MVTHPPLGYFPLVSKARNQYNQYGSTKLPFLFVIEQRKVVASTDKDEGGWSNNQKE